MSEVTNRSAATKLPTALVDQVRVGQALLVICSRGTGSSGPGNARLAELIATKFLDISFAKRPLAEVVELSASEHSLAEIQEFVADIYGDLAPSSGHLLVPRFRWAAIATTLFDLSLERAYDKCANAIQRCVPFVNDSQKIEETLMGSPAFMYLKLHGCIAHLEPGIPLIFSPDQYPSHNRNRHILFERLATLAAEYPIVLMTSSVSNPDARAMIQRMSLLPNTRPRSYIVANEFSDVDARLVDSKKFTPIALTSDEFFDYSTLQFRSQQEVSRIWLCKWDIRCAEGLQYLKTGQLVIN